MSLVSRLEGYAHLHDRRMTAIRLAENQPEHGREWMAEWAGLSDAEELGFPRRYSDDAAIQWRYLRGFEEGRTILYAHGCLDARRAVMAG